MAIWRPNVEFGEWKLRNISQVGEYKFPSNFQVISLKKKNADKLKHCFHTTPIKPSPMAYGLDWILNTYIKTLICQNLHYMPLF